MVCCDGTWQSSAHGTNADPSNITKISRLIAALGYGPDQNVCEAYNFLVSNYSLGDELCFFGFSRGACTVRATAGLVCRATIGSTGSLEETEWGRLPPPEEEGQYFESSKEGEDAKPLNNDVKIKVVGVWDTAGSLGYPDNAWRDVSDVNAPHGFQNTDIHPRRSASVKHLHTYRQVPEIENAFHALALEERRKPFALTLWWLPIDKQAKVIGNTNLIQYWFPGVHPFLDFNPMNIMGTIRSYSLATAKVLAADGKTKPNEKRKAGWETGLFIDSYDGIEDRAAGEEDRRPGAYPNPKPPVDKQSGAPGVYTTVDLTKECMHLVVEHLIQQGR
ncbi:hypothetical protein W97_04868 [Coniosporium apollinis CBS 100218]|uniref:T6SS Phospholipase effector Tle1-like catalytic domain-containing protein n=1 Tax=Coniosporium apollinis (strain CBS 100218) TaxID=1168221 RepID=R7YV15_CONA1|nr:uncharacterized protein W97_04868 [Coniosporium apollinis CBS 100218]EON65629.1 hypothetical protein W97_04868 [Coniosporium apollinis CBS 100218]